MIIDDPEVSYQISSFKLQVGTLVGWNFELEPKSAIASIMVRSLIESGLLLSPMQAWRRSTQVLHTKACHFSAKIGRGAFSRHARVTLAMASLPGHNRDHFSPCNLSQSVEKGPWASVRLRFSG
jgi:hypothetical protein